MFTLNQQYKKLFKKIPKIGVLGLNPHNGEYLKKSEEIKRLFLQFYILKKRV